MRDRTTRRKRGAIPIGALVALIVLALVGSIVGSLLHPSGASGTVPGTDTSTLIWATDNRVYYGNYNTPVFTTSDTAGRVTFGYCVDPVCTVPKAKSYATISVEDFCPEQAALIRASLWFGYGGPGFDPSMWPDTWYDGTQMDAGAYYVATHLIVSYATMSKPGRAYYNSGSEFIAYSAETYMGIDLYANVTNENSTMFQIFARADEVPDDYVCYFLDCGTWEYVQYIVSQDYYSRDGSLVLQKSSSVPSLGNDGVAYSLADASYGVYADEACTSLVATMTTDAAGKAQADDLSAGTYWVRELAAPTGYALDTSVYSIDVVAMDVVTLNVTDTPVYATPTLVAQKSDAQTGAQAQGAATLAGSEFTVRYYAGTYQLDNLPASPTRSWTFVTDASGRANFAASAKIAGDALYVDGSGNAVLPAGTVTVQETKAPAGYRLSDGSLRIYHVGSDGSFDSGGALAASVSDEVVRGGITVRKADAETSDGTAQGSATLAGAVFAVVSLNDQPVVVGSTSYKRGETVATLTTDEAGNASTGSRDLPYGTYELREVSAPTGYTSSNARLTITVSSEGVLHQASGPYTDTVARGGIAIHKADAETSSGAAQGDGSLAGAVFAVVSLNDQPVVVGGTSYKRGETVATLTTDEAGNASTGAQDLPCGSYAIREVTAPAGYALSSDTATVAVSSSGGVSEVVTPFTDTVLRGGVSVQKVDADTGQNAAQGNASLAGAVFSVTNASAHDVLVGGVSYPSGAVVTTIATDEDGLAATGASDLPYGTYELREVAAPEGYLCSEEVLRVEVRTPGALSTTTSPCANEVARGGLRVVKADAQLEADEPQGGASLAGATFSITNASNHDVVYAGTSHPNGAVVMTIVSDESGVAATGANDLPYGTYELREVAAPDGYLCSDEVWTFNVQANGIVVEADSSFLDEVVRGGIAIRKVDADTGLGEAQGNATLAGAKFSVTSLNEHPVVVDGITYLQGETVTTLETDESGVAATGEHDLPYGTYELREVAAPEGYLRSEESWTLDVREDGAVVETESACHDAVVRGGLRVVKADAESESGTAQGGASLEGAVFAIVNASEHDVVVGGGRYTSGAVVMSIATDENGVAATGMHDLPYGSYEVLELTAPEGYLVDPGQGQTVEVGEDGVVVDLAEAFCDHVLRGGVSLQKLDRDLASGTALADATLAGTTFAVVNANEQRVYVGDSWFEPGEQVLTLVTDMTGAAASASDALPYGTYRVYEITASEGYVLSDTAWQTVEVRNDGDIVACEQPFANRVVRSDVTGVKVESGTGSALPGVAFAVRSLTTGEQHVLVCDEEGRFSSSSDQAAHSSNTNANDQALADDGSIADESLLSSANGVWFSGSADTTTAPDDTLGALPFDVYRFEELETSASYGHTLVSFDVAVRADGTVVDLGFIDDNPIVLHTRARLSASGADEGMPDPEGSVVDTVSYSGLIPGATYQLEGSLVDRETGEALLDEDGQEITAQQSFTTTDGSGEVSVSIPLDSSGLLGTRATVFERLSLDGTELASHVDRYDNGQTVRFISIGTEAVGQTSGTHEEQAQEETVIVDTVTYTGLTPGRPYELHATLVLAESGAIVTSEGGEPVTATCSFVPLSAQGSIDVELSFDALDYVGRTVVVLEELYQDDVLVASHTDFDDTAQSVALLSLSTRARDAKTSTGDALADADASVIDEVSYQGLTPGDTYELRGVLVDAASGIPVSADDGQAVSSSVTFTPEKQRGSQDVVFELDATELAGTSTVVIETLYHDGSIVASHTDLNDNEQTICWHAREDMPVLGDERVESPLASVMGALALTALGAGLFLFTRTRCSL